MQNYCKKGLCIAFLFSLMFLSGWEIAKLKEERTVSTLSVAGQAENWGLGFGSEGMQPTGNATAEDLKQYDAYYVGDKNEKVIYLTFDCGYVKGQIGFLENLVKSQVLFILPN